MYIYIEGEREVKDKRHRREGETEKIWRDRREIYNEREQYIYICVYINI